MQQEISAVKYDILSHKGNSEINSKFLIAARDNFIDIILFIRKYNTYRILEYLFLVINLTYTNIDESA